MHEDDADELEIASDEVRRDLGCRSGDVIQRFMEANAGITVGGFGGYHT